MPEVLEALHAGRDHDQQVGPLARRGRAIYGQFARIGKALANPVRLELLDLLSQGERGVEELAGAAGMRLANVSAQLQQLRRAGLLDVHPAPEYAAGHLPGAVNIPYPELAARLAELPPETTVVAYCRGPYCVLSPDAVRLLRAHGRRARLLSGGIRAWRATGHPLAARSPFRG